MRGRMTLLAFLALTACKREPEEPQDGLVLLDPRSQLIRVSVDLRGVHPTEDELRAIEANPDLYEQFVDRYLADPRFLDRVEEIFNLRYRTRTGEVYEFSEEIREQLGLGAVDDGLLADSIAEEPLALIRKIADEDLPYEHVVLADYTMANPVLQRLWDIEVEDPDSSDVDHWQAGRYRDGRPHAGVLTMTTVWTRYPSAGVNSNRHRANTVSRILLCDDYLSRPVAFNRSQIDALTSGGDVNEIIASTTTCQACHASLDPLAGHFYGFWWEVSEDPLDQIVYRPEDEELWRDWSGYPPAYYGVPTNGLTELATWLAQDERFLQCGVQTVFEGLTQRTVTDDDWTELSGYRQAWEAEGTTIRSLVRAMVTSREYLVAEVKDEAQAERLVTVKTVSPSQLANIVEAKTGYRWSFSGRDGLTTHDLGLVVLSGGTDSRYVTTPSYDPSVGVVFVQERLAQAAAYHVASHDLDPERQGDAILLKYVTVEDVPETSREAFEGQIRDLYLQITGHALPAEDTATVDGLITLWKQLYSVEASPTTAWAGVVSVVLRDPQVIFY